MSKRLWFGFSALEVAYWSVHATFIGYVSAYLIHRGCSSTFVSLLLSANLLMAFIGSMFWGAVSDRYQTNRKTFFVSVAVSYLLLNLIYFCAGSTPVLALCYPLLGFFYQPMAANADAWLLAACRRDQRVFGRIRSMPSLFYAFVCAINGRLIAAYGYRFMIIGGTLFLGILLATAFLLPDVRLSEQGKNAPVSIGAAVKLMKNRHYGYLIAILFLVGLAVAPINNLKIVVYENVGGNVAHIGADSFFGALTQVPLIAMAGVLQRISLKKRYLAMTAFPLGMLLLTYGAVTPAMVIAGTVFYNIGYGFLLPTMRDVTETYVDSENRNLAHSLSDAVFNSFSGVVSLLYAGAVSDRWGVHAMLLICAATAMIPVCMALLKKTEKHNPPDDGK